MNLEIVSLFLILFAVIIIVWGIAVVHTLPGKIAKKRGHSQVEAIEITSYLGLLVFPVWMGALIWAYLVLVKLKATAETQARDKAQLMAGCKLPTLQQIGPLPEAFVVKSRFKGDDVDLKSKAGQWYGIYLGVYPYVRYRALLCRPAIGHAGVDHCCPRACSRQAGRLVKL